MRGTQAGNRMEAARDSCPQTLGSLSRARGGAGSAGQQRGGLSKAAPWCPGPAPQPRSSGGEGPAALRPPIGVRWRWLALAPIRTVPRPLHKLAFQQSTSGNSSACATFYRSEQVTALAHGKGGKTRTGVRGEAAQEMWPSLTCHRRPKK